MVIILYSILLQVIHEKCNLGFNLHKVSVLRMNINWIVSSARWVNIKHRAIGIMYSVTSISIKSLKFIWGHKSWFWFHTNNHFIDIGTSMHITYLWLPKYVFFYHFHPQKWNFQNASILKACKIKRFFSTVLLSLYAVTNIR